MTVTTPSNEIETRINHLKQRLDKAGIEAALILQNSDLFYFAGTIQQAHLFVPVDGEPLLMVRKDVERAMAESAIRKIVPISRPQELPELLRGNGHAIPRRLGLVSIPFFFEKVRGYWEPSFTSQVLHYLLPQFGGLHLYALSFISDFFPASQGLWAVADITGYIIVIWLVMIFVFKRKAL